MTSIRGGASSPVHILGLSAYYHDSAACLLRDGEIIAAAQEERFTRVKHDARFPGNAVSYCLGEAGIAAHELDAVVFYEKPLVKFDRLLETWLAVAPAGFATFREAMPIWAREKLHLSRRIRGRIGARAPLYFADHHESHAASAFFPSPYEEAAVLTLDAVGEWATSAIGSGRGNRIGLTHEMRFPHSLGMLYSAFTYYTGFKVNSGEYKLMGLAPYGRPIYRDLILEKIARVREDGSLWLDMSYFGYCRSATITSEKFHRLFGGAPRDAESWITQREMDLAASVQAVCEEVVLRIGRHVHRQTGLKRAVLAGGVALNCVANGRLLREGPFDDLWIQPAAGDAGGALGAAFLAWHHVMGRPRSPGPRDAQKGSLLGPHFSDEEIRFFLDAVGAAYERIPEEDRLLDRVADLIEREKVVGWFHGRLEYGPRALGARSILGDPRSVRMQRIMNVKIKFRESFRPFAPCVLREYADVVFEMKPDQDSPYMLIVAPIREAFRTALGPDDIARMQDRDLAVRVSVPRSTLPAITHVDYSARIQTVDAERHGRYYRLLQQFHRRTGCPVLVNTSFNIRGEPIVCTPEDAYRCFMGTGMDALVLENYVLVKESQPDALAVNSAMYKARFTLD